MVGARERGSQWVRQRRHLRRGEGPGVVVPPHPHKEEREQKIFHLPLLPGAFIRAAHRYNTAPGPPPPDRVLEVDSVI